MCDRATLTPPDLAWTWQREFPGMPDQLGHLRAGLRTLLEDCPATYDITLLVTELAANAIAHSASGRPGGTFAVVWFRLDEPSDPACGSLR